MTMSVDALYCEPPFLLFVISRCDVSS